MKSFFVPIAVETEFGSDPQVNFVEYSPIVELIVPPLPPFIRHLTWDTMHRVDEAFAIAQLNNRPRPQYADRQDIGNYENISLHHAILCLKQQIISHLGEQALNAQIMYSKFYLDKDGRLVSPFSKNPTPFNLERLYDVIQETQGYLETKYDMAPSTEDVLWLDQNLETVLPLVFSPEFLQTRQGLEVSELLGLRKVETLLRQAEEGDLIVLFSPYSSHRATEIAYNVTMVGEVKMEMGVKVLHFTYARNQLNLTAYRQQSLTLDPGQTTLYGAADFVSQPVLVKNTSRNNLLKQLDIYENKELIALYQQAIDITLREDTDDSDLISLKTVFDEMIEGMLNGTISPNQSAVLRQKLEKAAMHNYQVLSQRYGTEHVLSSSDKLFINQTIAGLGRGGLCGMIDLVLGREGLGIQDQHGELTFECPHCHYINTRPFGQLVEYCQNSKCGKQIPRC